MTHLEILMLLAWSSPLVVLVAGGIWATAGQTNETNETQRAEND